MHESIKNKLLSILSFISIIISLSIVALIPIPNSYEISIYNVYPWYFWLTLMIPILLLFYRIIMFFKTNRNDQELFYSYDIILLIFGAIISLSIFLLLPFFRNYYLYNSADTLTQLYYITYISLNGHFGVDNIYPILHIFVVSLSYLTGINARILMFFVPSIFLFLFIFSMYLLSTALNFNKKQSLFVILLSIIPIFGLDMVYLVPSAEAFFLIPLVLYVLIKSRTSSTNISFSIILVILLVLLPFFHPEATFFVIVIFLVILIDQIIGNKQLKTVFKNYNKSFISKPNTILTPLILVSVAFFTWFSSCIIFGNTIQTVYNSLILNIGTSTVELYTGIINEFQVPLNQLLELIFKIYGADGIYIILAAIPTLTICLKILLRKKVDTTNSILASIFIITAILAAIFLFKNFIIGERPIKYLLMISILISSLFISSLISKYYKKPSFLNKVYFVIVSVLIISTIFISFINTYPSPTIDSYNYQVQSTDYNGMSFYFNHKNQSIPLLSITLSQEGRWSQLLALTNSSITGSNSIIPIDHFGYNQSQYMGNSYSKDNYMLFNELTEQFYPTLYPQYQNEWKFTPQDFTKLNNDPTVNLIYDNNGIKLYYIIGDQNQ